nr:hypothetical protein [Sphingobium cloacae]
MKAALSITGIAGSQDRAALAVLSAAADVAEPLTTILSAETAGAVAVVEGAGGSSPTTCCNSSCCV